MYEMSERKTERKKVKEETKKEGKKTRGKERSRTGKQTCGQAENQLDFGKVDIDKGGKYRAVRGDKETTDKDETKVRLYDGWTQGLGKSARELITDIDWICDRRRIKDCLLNYVNRR